MENFYDKKEVFEDKDFSFLKEEVKAEEVIEKPVEKESVVEKKIEQVVEKKKSNEVFVYTGKTIKIDELVIPAGVVKMERKVYNELSQKSGLVLATDEQIKRYYKEG